MRKHDMKCLRILHLIFALVLMSGLFFNITPTAQGFSAWTSKESNTLLSVIDKPQWRIAYSFVADCPDDFRQKEAELKELITETLQLWLQPLREWYPDREFTDNFVFVRMPDVAACGVARRGRQEGDLRITFDCKLDGPSFALMPIGKSIPYLCIKTSKIGREKMGLGIISALIHEVGHAFGLKDIYVEEGKRVSTGGHTGTKGKQPASVMSGILFGTVDSPQLGADDKNGIIYLYKYLYEDHPANDCFFPDYVRVAHDGSCEPKYPLIFEVKHGGDIHTLNGDPNTVEWVLRGDPTLDINARDASGFTALHHAVQCGDSKIVKALLAQVGIKANLLNTHKRTPAQLARILKHTQLAKMIEAHPSSKRPPIAWDVAPKGKLTTTWGHLKKQY